jgi:hypothetical protein
MKFEIYILKGPHVPEDQKQRQSTPSTLKAVKQETRDFQHKHFGICH